jgi:hypothetical protein
MIFDGGKAEREPVIVYTPIRVAIEEAIGILPAKRGKDAKRRSSDQTVRRNHNRL